MEVLILKIVRDARFPAFSTSIDSKRHNLEIKDAPHWRQLAPEYVADLPAN
jgi:hypothetical protein